MPFRNTYLNINLKNIIHNFDILQSSIGNSMLFPVIKADAYGHGIVEVAKSLSTRAKCFCVATIDEALSLRKANINNNIIVLGISDSKSFKAAVEHNIILSIESNQSLIDLNEIAKSLNKIVPIQLAINTGMNRIGISSIEDFKNIIELIGNLDYIKLSYAFSHFANADSGDDLDEYSLHQIQLFEEYIKYLPNDCIISLENSAALLKLSKHYTACRSGIALYGYPPVKTDLNLKPAMEWISQVVSIHSLKKGDTIGYACNYTLEKDSKVAVVSIGYADGYKRCFSNKSKVIINNKFANLIGNVCMDQIMVDITNIDDVEVGSKVLLMGEDKCIKIDAQDLANIANTISYEILCSPTSRCYKMYN